MREIDTSIRIEAPPERVWEVLTDMPAHAQWNPFILEFSGDLRVGGRLRVKIQPADRKPMVFKPTVLGCGPAQKLRWLGRFLLPRIIDGEHVFELTPIDDGAATQFRQSERFRGILVPLIGSIIEPTRRGFEAMNAALKARAEGGAS